MCVSSAGEDVEHLLVNCGEFERDRWVLMDEVSGIVEVEEYARRLSVIAVGKRCGGSKWHRWKRCVNVLCIG